MPSRIIWLTSARHSRMQADVYVSNLYLAVSHAGLCTDPDGRLSGVGGGYDLHPDAGRKNPASCEWNNRLMRRRRGPIGGRWDRGILHRCASHSIQGPIQPHSHGLRPHSLRLRPHVETLRPHAHGLRPRFPGISILARIYARMSPGSIHTRSASVHTRRDFLHTRSASVHTWRESVHTRTDFIHVRSNSVHTWSGSLHTLRGVRCSFPHPRRCFEARSECSETPSTRGENSSTREGTSSTLGATPPTRGAAPPTRGAASTALARACSGCIGVQSAFVHDNA